MPAPSEADQYVKNAAEAREQAEKCASAADKESWLKITEEWLRLARSSEGRK